MEEAVRALREAAGGAMQNAYAPYSRFRVGAALIGSDGTVGAGCNVENAAYPATLCAERVAVGCLLARGVREFELLVIMTESQSPVPPCGICLQVLGELAPSLTIVSFTAGGAETRWTLAQLLPSPFTPEFLE